MDFSEAKFEGAAGVGSSCATCGAALTSQYWLAGVASVCGACAAQLQVARPSNGAFFRFLKAIGLGFGAGLLGAIGYGAIIFFSGYELALITIGIGWFIGRAVMMGSEHRGGRGYQVLAVVLTYVCCMLAFVPSVVKGFLGAAEPVSMPVALLIAPFIAQAIPFLGEMGPIGLLILGFGMCRAWRETAKVVIEVAGPFALAPATAEKTAPVTSVAVL